MKKIEKLSNKTVGLEGKVKGMRIKLLGVAILNPYEIEALRKGPANIYPPTNPQDVRYRIGILNNSSIPKKQDGSLPDVYYESKPRTGHIKLNDRAYKEILFTPVMLFERIG